MFETKQQIQNASLPKLNWERDCLALLSNRNFLNDISVYKPYKLSSKLKLIELLRNCYLETSGTIGNNNASETNNQSLKLPPITSNNKYNDMPVTLAT